MVNPKSLSILIKQGDIAYQITQVQARRAGKANVGIKHMEPDELIKFHWKRIEFLEWLKPLAKKQIQIVLQEMQLNPSPDDLQIAKMALVNDLLPSMKNEI